MVRFCSYPLDRVEKRPASQAVCRGFNSRRPLQHSATWLPHKVAPSLPEFSLEGSPLADEPPLPLLSAASARSVAS
jgi:hypothetical protein